MCGLFGYIGSEPPDLEILSECIALAATRGPHSHGMVWIDSGRIATIRGDGPAPREIVDALPADARFIIGHSRLATTGTYAGGAPRIEDTMPFVSDGADRQVAIVHNGNVREYRKIAAAHAISLTTGCDSEVLAHLAARSASALRDSLVETIKIVDEGRPFAIVAISSDGALAACHRELPIYLAQDGRGLYLCSREPQLDGRASVAPSPFFFHSKLPIKETAA